MNKLMIGLAALCVLPMATALPARAEVPAARHDSAEKMRRLDIMLMVTGLRCRLETEDFQPDFQAFEARHLTELNAANRELRADLEQRMAPALAQKMFDQMSVVMANTYGNGHPWLGCHELKGLAKDLAASDGPDSLLKAADEVLVGDSRHVAAAP